MFLGTRHKQKDRDIVPGLQSTDGILDDGWSLGDYGIKTGAALKLVAVHTTLFCRLCWTVIGGEEKTCCAHLKRVCAKWYYNRAHWCGKEVWDPIGYADPRCIWNEEPMSIRCPHPECAERFRKSDKKTDKKLTRINFPSKNKGKNGSTHKCAHVQFHRGTGLTAPTIEVLFDDSNDRHNTPINTVRMHSCIHISTHSHIHAHIHAHMQPYAREIISRIWHLDNAKNCCCSVVKSSSMPVSICPWCGAVA